MKRCTVVAVTQVAVLSVFVLNQVALITWHVHAGLERPWALLYLLGTPCAVLFAMFPVNFTCNSLLNLVYAAGRRLRENSRYYVCQLPAPASMPPGTPYPPVTIHVPVYTEDFQTVILPTLENAVAARDYYRRHYGGHCNVVVSDDGIMKLSLNGYQVLQHSDTVARVRHYTRLQVACVGRVTQGRRGRFKKASNMNYTLNLFRKRLHETYDAEPPASVLVHGDVTFGPFVLLLDSDSRVPEDGIAGGVRYLMQHPQAAFLQFRTRPLSNNNNNSNYFSRQIARFTSNLYDVVFALVTRGGEPAPLVGHNVLLRYEALEACKLVRTTWFGYEEHHYWHENRVSEDFDFSMRAHRRGYYGVYANVSPPYEEGVTFCYADELGKLSKFAYGASEILWSRRFWCEYVRQAPVPWAAKVNLTAYLLSYYALASAVVVAPLHLVLSCVTHVHARTHWYLFMTDPVVVMVVSFLVFSVLGPVSTVRVYRQLPDSDASSSSSSWRVQLLHGLFMFVFYNSVSFAVCAGVVTHLSRGRLTVPWGATTRKTWDGTSVWQLLYEFRWQYVVMTLYFGGAAVYACVRCLHWYGAVPLTMLWLGHVLGPLLLTPGLKFILRVR